MAVNYSKSDIEESLAEDKDAFMEGEHVHAERVEYETEKAVGLPRVDTDDDLFWLPKSQIHCDVLTDESAVIAIPNWLVEAKDEEDTPISLIREKV